MHDLLVTLSVAELGIASEIAHQDHLVDAPGHRSARSRIPRDHHLALPDRHSSQWTSLGPCERGLWPAYIATLEKQARSRCAGWFHGARTSSTGAMARPQLQNACVLSQKPGCRAGHAQRTRGSGSSIDLNVGAWPHVTHSSNAVTALPTSWATEAKQSFGRLLDRCPARAVRTETSPVDCGAGAGGPCE